MPYTLSSFLAWMWSVGPAPGRCVVLIAVPSFLVWMWSRWACRPVGPTSMLKGACLSAGGMCTSDIGRTGYLNGS
jgi:hypothetical protein